MKYYTHLSAHQKKFSSKLLSLYRIYPQNNLNTPSSKTTATVITLSPTLLTTTTFSHSSSYTITPTPPTPSTSSEQDSICLLSFIPAPCPLNHTFCKQHTSTILLLSSSKNYPPFSLRLTKFNVPCTPKCPPGLLC